MLGMFNYLAKFLPNLSSTLKPLSSLLKYDAHWSWGSMQMIAFQEAKQLVNNAVTLTYFDPNKPTIISTDASSFGLGAVILQQHKDGMKPVAFGMRTLTLAEVCYAQIEKGAPGKCVGM